MPELVEVRVPVPRERQGCGLWICSQTPQVAADALDLAGPAHAVLQRTLTTGELSKMAEDHDRATQKMREELASMQQALRAERSAATKLRSELEMDHKTCLDDAVQVARVTMKLSFEQARGCLEERLAAAATKHDKLVAELRKEIADTEEAAKQETARLFERRVKGLQEELHDSGRTSLQRLDAAKLSHSQEVEALQAEQRRSLAVLQSELKTLTDKLAMRDADVLTAQSMVRAEADLRMQNLQAQSEKERSWLQGLLREQKDEIRSLHAANLSLLQDTRTEMTRLTEKLNDDHRETFAALRGSSMKGVIGEAVVRTTFEGLELGGVLEDTRHDDTPGSEDFLWTFKSPGGEELRVSCETKFSQRLHSKHDLAKHEERIREASASGKANCGMFLSLSCRVPNTRAVEIKVLSGIPVLYFSRDANDESAISATALVALAFRTVSQLAPFITRPKDEREGAAVAIAEVAKSLEKQVGQLESLEKQISAVKGHVEKLSTTHKNLLKIREAMWTEINSLLSTHPMLLAAADEPAVSEVVAAPLLQQPEVEQVVAQVTAYHTEKNRAPPSFKALALSEELLAYVEKTNMPLSFYTALAKDLRPKQTRKRKATEEAVEIERAEGASSFAALEAPSTAQAASG